MTTMCLLCPDAVDSCRECSERRDPGNPRKLQRGWLQIFYLGDTFCLHLTVKHGTDDASHYHHFKHDHDGPDCECATGNWWGGRPEPIIEEMDDE